MAYWHVNRVRGTAKVYFDVYAYTPVTSAKEKFKKKSLVESIYDNLNGCEPRDTLTKIIIKDYKLVERTVDEDDPE